MIILIYIVSNTSGGAGKFLCYFIPYMFVQIFFSCYFDVNNSMVSISSFFSTFHYNWYY